MDEKDKKLEKIYSRSGFKMPKLQYFGTKGKQLQDVNQNKVKKMIKILAVVIIALFVANTIIRTISPIIDTQCISMAKAIATKISNEQASKVMEKYNYDDLTNIVKDDDGNIKMISANIITVNQIISDIPILMQEELNKIENSRFYIKLGTFTGTKILSGRGPNIEIKMSAIGNVETNLRSEFTAAGINQTIHRVYLEIKCNVVILTPFNSIDEQIVNQVLLAEGVIVGNIPNTYYNFEGMQQDNLIDVIE